MAPAPTRAGQLSCDHVTGEMHLASEWVFREIPAAWLGRAEARLTGGEEGRERMREHELTHLRAHRTSDGSLALDFWADDLPYRIRIRDESVLREVREASKHVRVAGGDWPGQVIPECVDCRVPMRRATPLQLICPQLLAPSLLADAARVPISDEYRPALLSLRVEHHGYRPTRFPSGYGLAPQLSRRTSGSRGHVPHGPPRQAGVS